MKFTLSATKQEATDTFSFIFAPERPLQWKAGQLLRYVLNHPNPDDRGVERFFSIASAPHEKHMMWPLMAPVQMMCARIGLVTGKGLAGALRDKFPKRLIALVAVALLIANTINVGADLFGMADAAKMLTGFNSHLQARGKPLVRPNT